MAAAEGRVDRDTVLEERGRDLDWVAVEWVEVAAPEERARAVAELEELGVAAPALAADCGKAGAAEAEDLVVEVVRAEARAVEAPEVGVELAEVQVAAPEVAEDLVVGVVQVEARTVEVLEVGVELAGV